MMYDVTALSHDPARLLGQFHRAHQAELGAAEVVTAFTDLWQQQVPPAALEAAALRVLAAQEGLVVRGTTTDRAGRAGVAVSVDSGYSGLPTRYTLIFNPATGMLLDAEQVLTTTAGLLNVHRPLRHRLPGMARLRHSTHDRAGPAHPPHPLTRRQPPPDSGKPTHITPAGPASGSPACRLVAADRSFRGKFPDQCVIAGVPARPCASASREPAARSPRSRPLLTVFPGSSSAGLRPWVPAR